MVGGFLMCMVIMGWTLVGRALYVAISKER